MGRGKHKPWTHQAKKEAYNARKKKKDYLKGGYGIPHSPYGKEKRN